MNKLNFIGFHATLKDNVNSIIKDGFIINKHRNNEWLGYGIYLFLYKADAESWAKGTHYCKDNPAIIKCQTEVEQHRYLDLDDPENMNKYNQYYKRTLSLLSENKKSIIFKNKHEAMCWGLNIYKTDNNIDLIKYTFENNRTRNKMKYEYNKNGYNYNEVQLCISRNEIILKKEVCS